MIRWMLKEHPWTFALFLLLYFVVGAGVISTWAFMFSDMPMMEQSNNPLEMWIDYLKEFLPLIAV